MAGKAGRRAGTLDAPRWIMPTRILLATDFSDASEEAARQAHAIAARDHAALGICHQVPLPVPAGTQLPPWVESQIETTIAMHKQAQAALEKRAVELSSGGVQKVEVFLEDGEGYAAIVKRADAWGADLIVVGSHGRTGLSRVLLGSVAEKVVRHASCPVLVARKAPHGGPVVTATDFSEAAKAGLRAAAVEAARNGSRLHVLYVFSLGWPGGTPFAVDASGLSSVTSDVEALRQANEELEKEIAEAKRGLLVHAEGEVLVGDPSSTIVRRAEDLGARLVALSTHGRTGLSRVLLGSVAERVVRLAHTSVLAVRGHATA
jgi:nucleotide-binding universal stress UspA family protein